MPNLTATNGTIDIPLTGSNTPNVQPFATDGSVSAAPVSLQTTGWQAGDEPPADVENSFRAGAWNWFSRLEACGLFVQRATGGITLGGSYAAGNHLRLTYNGHSNDYVLTSADTTAALVGAHWATQLTQDTALRDLFQFCPTSSGLALVWTVPGNNMAHPPTVSAVSGTTTIAYADVFGGSGAPLLVLTAPANAQQLPLVHGTATAKEIGAKLHWYGSAKGGAFRAGTWGDDAAAPANVGAASLGVGSGVKASGFASVAFGYGSEAVGDFSMATGLNAHAGDDHALAIGSESVADSVDAVAVGHGATAGGDAVAVGHGASAADESIAIGLNATSDASDCVVLGAGASGGSFFGGVTIGSGAVAESPLELTANVPQEALAGGDGLARTALRRMNFYGTFAASGSAIKIPRAGAYAGTLTCAATRTGGAGSAGDGATWILPVSIFSNGSVLTVTGIASEGGGGTPPTFSQGVGSGWFLAYKTAGATDLYFSATTSGGVGDTAIAMVTLNMVRVCTT